MKYKVGDKVKVRKWNDMEAEFGINEDGNINTPVFRFTKHMEDYCDKSATIIGNDVDDDGDYYYTLKIDSMDSYEKFFYFTDEMLETVNDEYSPVILGIDIYSLVKELSDKFLGDSPDMTESEKAAYNFGKEQILSLLDQSLNELCKEDGVVTPIYIVHVPGLNVVTDFASIDEIQERLGDDK